jgi:phage terminase small subunit
MIHGCKAKTNLSEKQRKFVELYDGNATETARKAGYSGNENVLGKTGYDLLRNPKIIEALKKRDAKSVVRRQIKGREALQMFWTEIIEDNENQLKDRLKAAELLGKSMAMFTENVRMYGTIGHLTDSQLIERLRSAIATLPEEVLNRLRLQVAKRELPRPDRADDGSVIVN